jgi:hypothetical protein
MTCSKRRAPDIETELGASLEDVLYAESFSMILIESSNILDIMSYECSTLFKCLLCNSAQI